MALSLTACLLYHTQKGLSTSFSTFLKVFQIVSSKESFLCDSQINLPLSSASVNCFFHKFFNKPFYTLFLINWNPLNISISLLCEIESHHSSPVYLYYCSRPSQSPGQNAFQITFDDGILSCMSRDFGIYMPKHLAG